MDPISSRPADATAREIALWSLPALLLGLVLRVALTMHMPLAFLSSDTNEFFSSKLFGGSRTFLPKLIYETPPLLGLPLLPSVALFQHFVGLIMILACGFLCARWLRSWRWWIIPFTSIMAVHPTLLWYEHFALPDSMFTVLLILACLAGTHFYQKPTAGSFAILFAAMLLVAGMRQEGFLFVAFGLALTIRVFWSDRKRLRIFAPLAVILSLGIVMLTRTNQGGYMLLTSLIQWAPDQLRSEPGLSPRIAKLREHFKSRWAAYPDDHNMSRKLIITEVENYLVYERGATNRRLRNQSAALCQPLAFELALRNFWRLPGLAFNKFRATHHENPAPDFGAEWAHDKHLRIFYGREDEPSKERKLMKLYLGREYTSKSEMESDLPRLYRVFAEDRLSQFQRAFYRWEYAWEILPAKTVGPQTLPGLPLLYFLAAAGFLAILFREGRSISEKQMWIVMLLFQAFVILLTGSLRSRYRLSFEPWFFLGFFAFLDALVALGKNALKASAAPAPAATPAPAADTPSSDTART